MDQMHQHTHWTSFSKIYRHGRESRIRYWFYGLLFLLAITLFLPWTQHIRARGTVTTLRPEQRPQELNTVIPGRVLKWYVKEGDVVKPGDTLLQLAEIKEDYFDPELVNRTGQQLQSKQQSIALYRNKAETAGNQMSALGNALELKLQQLQMKRYQLQVKLQTDSMEWQAVLNDLSIATKQWQRQRVLYDSGLVSLTQLEQRNQVYQQAQAKKTAAENKITATKQDLLITETEFNTVKQDYREKISKAEGDQLQSLSQAATGEAEVAKLQNQYANYSIRNGFYYITAPQGGQITKARKAGIGEIVKEGDMIVEIVPDRFQYAVELFVRPVDLPLVSTGQSVRFQFDGFPAIVFSGWPRSSYGTFAGKVSAVENSVSANGKFRVLVTEDPVQKPWPPQLRMGTGAQAIALLKDVPVWYELWRNINGFPPDYYQPSTPSKEKK